MERQNRVPRSVVYQLSLLMKKLFIVIGYATQPAIGRGVSYGVWSTCNLTDEMVQEYLEHHQEKHNSPVDNWIIEV